MGCLESTRHRLLSAPAAASATPAAPARLAAPWRTVSVLALAVCAALSLTQAAGATSAADPAQRRAQAQAQPQTQALPVAIPATHRRIGSRAVSHDSIAATLVRYERRDGRNAGMGGEHFSTVVADDGTFMGFANISLDLVDRELPSAERSEAVARAFLSRAAPDLLPTMRITSISPYDEPLRVARPGGSQVVQVSGMRVKARNTADDSWFWVIVGGDEQPLAFEREVGWSYLRFSRSTEHWLRDNWVIAHDRQASR